MTNGLLGISLPGIPAAPQANTHDVLAQIASVANGQPQQQLAPVFTPAQPTREFAEAIGAINAKGYGMVRLIGRAAQMFGVLNQHPGITATYEVPGFGTLGNNPSNKPVEDPAIVLAIARELTAMPVNPNGIERPQPVQQVAPAQLGILSPSAPVSNPALAADPVPGFVAPGQQTAHPQAMTSNVQIPGLLASVPTATAAAVLAQNATPAQPTDSIPAPADKPKRKYTRRTKPDGTSTAPADDSFGDAAWLFVNSRPNLNTIDLHDWIRSLCDQIARHHQLVVPDLRTVVDVNHPLGCGRWKGHLTAFARAMAAKLEPAAYSLRLAPNDEIALCVLDGMRAAKRQAPDGQESTDPVFELIVFGD